jgi:hypothetical protein
MPSETACDRFGDVPSCVPVDGQPGAAGAGSPPTPSLPETVYVLVHAKTGTVMPLAAHGRGYSHWEPERRHNAEGQLMQMPLPRTPQPRFFLTHAAAALARTRWAQGAASIEYLDESGDRYQWKHDNVTGRDATDLSILAVKLVLP